MTYTPQPGTIPHRVIEFLKLQPPGTEFSTYALADAIGHAGASLCVYLSIPREHGVLKAEKRVPSLGGQKTYYWSLGDCVPLPKPDDYEPDDPLRNAPGQPPALAPAKPQPAANTVVKRKPPKPAAPAAPTTDSDKPGAVFGWFSDGSLVIRRPGAGDTVLTPDESTELVKFIHQVRG